MLLKILILNAILAQILQGMRDLSDPVSISDIPGAGHREAGGFSGFVCSLTFSFYGGILFLINNLRKHCV